jgi:hypothetical protein
MVGEALYRLLEYSILPAVLCIYGGCGQTGRNNAAGRNYAWSRGDTKGDREDLLRFLDEGLDQRAALGYFSAHSNCRPEVLFDLACGWAQLGDTARAKETLRETLDRSSPGARKELAEGAWVDPGFNPLRTEDELEAFEEILALPRRRLSRLRPPPDPTPAPRPTSGS